MNKAPDNHDESIKPEQLRPFVERHAAALTLFARTWCRWPEDVVQESFLELARQPRWPQCPVAWIYRVVRNRAISYARAADRRLKHERVVAGARPAWFTVNADAAIDAQTATAALAELPADEREVIVGHLWGGLTFAQLADVTGLPASTAHRRYESGLRRLREQIGIKKGVDTP